MLFCFSTYVFPCCISLSNFCDLISPQGGTGSCFSHCYDHWRRSSWSPYLLLKSGFQQQQQHFCFRGCFTLLCDFYSFVGSSANIFCLERLIGQCSSYQWTNMFSFSLRCVWFVLFLCSPRASCLTWQNSGFDMARICSLNRKQQHRRNHMKQQSVPFLSAQNWQVPLFSGSAISVCWGFFISMIR